MDLLLHKTVQMRLEALKRAPKGAYVFSGPAHIGKFTATKLLAKSLHCDKPDCTAAHLIDVGNYPDFIVLEPAKETSIGIAQVHEVIENLNKTRFDQNGWRMVVIPRAELLTTEAQNALLKIVEEPPEQTMFILICQQASQLLPTIQSRIENIYFVPSTDEQTAIYLTEAGYINASELIKLSSNRVGLAITLAQDQTLFDQYNQIKATVESLPTNSLIQRIIVLSALADKSNDLAILLELLGSHIQRLMRDKPSLKQIKASKALVLYQQRVSSNVAIKSALTELALAL